MGLSQSLRLAKTDANEQMEIIIDARRMQRLTENILDVTKIESQLLRLNKERLNLNDLVSNAIVDLENQIREDKKIKLELLCNEDVFVEADKQRIIEVSSNLLSKREL